MMYREEFHTWKMGLKKEKEKKKNLDTRTIAFEILFFAPGSQGFPHLHQNRSKRWYIPNFPKFSRESRQVIVNLTENLKVEKMTTSHFADPSIAMLSTSGGDTVKLFDVSLGLGDPCTLSYSPSPGHHVYSVKWSHTSESLHMLFPFSLFFLVFGCGENVRKEKVLEFRTLKSRKFCFRCRE